jgi:hypothetical protein
MWKMFGTALVIGAAAIVASGSADALQLLVTGIDKNADGSSTWRFAVRLDPGEALLPNLDFITIYNFAGLVGMPKTPPGWVFSSGASGRTPGWDGYAVVHPRVQQGQPDLTWTTKRPYPAGSEIDGFAATTRAGATSEGTYAAQSVR